MLSSRSKVFKDNVHGYISIPEDYVREFIDTDLFQRLRHIEQTGMRTLFPSARHDRFIHSLGVYHLGHKAFECFMNNVRISYPDSHFKVKSNKKDNEKFWRECQILFEIACLMHDCGHAPFSHTFEYAYDLEPEGNTILREKIMEYIGSRRFKEEYDGEGRPHEVMSALLVCTEYNNAVERILQASAGASDTPLFDIDDATEFIVRMIIGYNYPKNDKAHQMQNCMISMLNSKSIDVDSLDYIIRDAQMSGINNMSIDVDRLLQSLTVVEVTEFINVPLRNKEINAIILKGNCCPLDKKNASFSGRFEGEIALNKGISKASIGNGPVILDANAKVTQACKIVGSENLDKIITVTGTTYKELSETESFGKLFVSGILENSLSIEGIEVAFKEGTSVEGNLISEEMQITSASLRGKIFGKFSGEMLGNHENLSENARLVVKFGFHKSSLSVIQNVIIARNYEYQWVYSHHKVVYYANYLEIELLRQCIRYILKKNGQPLHATDEIQKILSWKTMIGKSESEPECEAYNLYGHKFQRPTDADLQNLFNYCWIDCTEEDEVYRYLLEYRSRRFRKSLWKSYAEMRNFLSGFTNNQIIDLQEMLVEFSSNNEDNQELSGYRLKKQYGYPNKQFCQELYELGLDDVVWVSGDSKLKELSPVMTYIHFKDRDMTYGSVSTPNNIRSIEKLNLFYIYYRPVEGVEINSEVIQQHLKSTLNTWLSEKSSD